MKKIMIIVAALLIASAPIKAEKILWVRTTLPAANVDSDNRHRSEEIMQQMINVSGIKARDMRNIDYLAIDTDGDTLFKEYAASGDYDLVIMYDLPQFTTGFQTVADLDGTGLHNFQTYIGRSDTVFHADTDLLVISGGYFPPGSVFADSCSVIDTVTVPAGNVSWDDGSGTDAKQGPMQNAAGDSIWSLPGCHAQRTVIDASPSYITPLMYPDRTVFATETDSLICEHWEMEKTSGSKVLFLGLYYSASMQATWYATLAKYYPVTPIDVSVAFNAIGSDVDTVGMGGNISEFLTWCEANSFPVHFWVAEHGTDGNPYFNDFASRLSSHPDIYSVGITQVSSVYEAFFAADVSNHLDRWEEDLDSLRADVNWNGVVDTTIMYPWNSEFDDGGGDGLGKMMNDILPELNITELWSRGPASVAVQHYGWPYSENYTLMFPQKYWLNSLSSDPILMYGRAMGYETSAQRDSLSYYDKGHFGADLFVHVTGGRGLTIPGSASLQRYYENETNWQMVGRLPYTGVITCYSAAVFADYNNDTDHEPSDFYAISMVRTIKQAVDFYNGLAGDRVVYRLTQVDDIKHDRSLGRNWPNSHVSHNSD